MSNLAATDDLFFNRAGLDRGKVEGLTDSCLVGADDGELFLEYAQSESFAFDDGRLKSASFDTNQGFGLRAVADEATGYAHASELSEAAIGRAGLLTVVQDLKLKELAEGVIPLETGEVDTDLMAYFAQSEQIPTAVSIGLSMNEDGTVAMSGGLLIQALPPHDDKIIGQIGSRIPELPPIEELLQSGKTPEDVLALLFEGIKYEVLEKRPLRFQCSCSRERSEKALITLGREEIEQLLADEGQAVIDCHFCHEQYVFDAVELELIIEEMEE